MHRRSPDRGNGKGKLDGLEVRLIDVPTSSVAELSHVLRTLARILVRSHHPASEHTAIADELRPSSTLTVLPGLAPHHGTNEAA
jgi:hypothetical protein